MPSLVRFFSRSTRVLAPPTSLPGNRSLKEVDPAMWKLIAKESVRQFQGIELIASENFTSRAVLECLGSSPHNKYAEGYPGNRYYGGTEVVDEIENLTRARALETFKLDSSQWGVNVQPLSGSPANFAAYTSLLRPHDRLMGLDLPCGGHLTHGFYTATRRVSASSIYFESMPYGLTPDGFVDYDSLAALAARFKPRLIICGASAYPRDWDYARLREIANAVGTTAHPTYLLCDMSHTNGLIAAGLLRNPFEYCDLVTTTTHKTLRGPRGGMIFAKAPLMQAVNDAVFPCLQGGPHIHQVAAIGTALAEVQTPAFKKYSEQTLANSRRLAEVLMEGGLKLSSGGTDTHILLVDLRSMGLTGSKMQKLLDAVGITANKNSVVGDKSAQTPGGIRLGSPAMTTRGCDTVAFEQIGKFLLEACQLARSIQERTGPKLAPFVAELEGNGEVQNLHRRVQEFSVQFPYPGSADPFEPRELAKEIDA